MFVVSIMGMLQKLESGSALKYLNAMAKIELVTFLKHSTFLSCTQSPWVKVGGHHSSFAL